jgi:predicted transcriptional regulator
MNQKGITENQIASLLECRQITISDKLNGAVECGFIYNEASKIKHVFFPEYGYEFLFSRDNVA